MCTLYDRTIRGHPEPIAQDNGNFDLTKYLLTFVSIGESDDLLATPDATTEPANGTESNILRDIQNRLYGTSVIIYLMFTFAIILAITVVTVYAVKFILSRKRALKGSLNEQDTTRTANPYSEYEETDYGPGMPGQTSSMPHQKRANQSGKQ